MSYRPCANNRSVFETMEMSPMYLAAAQTAHDPCQQQTKTKIFPHVPQANR